MIIEVSVDEFLMSNLDQGTSVLLISQLWCL